VNEALEIRKKQQQCDKGEEQNNKSGSNENE